VKDAKYIDKIRFTKRISMNLIQDILHELRIAIKGG